MEGVRLMGLSLWDQKTGENKRVSEPALCVGPKLDAVTVLTVCLLE